MNLRAFEGADAAELLAVWNASMIRDRINPGIFAAKVLLDPNFDPNLLPVAVEDGRLVGFVLALDRRVPFYEWGTEPEQAWITAFGVHPDYRRRGIGRALFDYALERLALRGRTSVAIAPYEPNYFAPGVDVEAYAPAYSFLTGGLGFEPFDRAISMGIDLTAFAIPAEISALERQLQQTSRIAVRPLEPHHLPALNRFVVEHFGWGWYDYLRQSLLEFYGERHLPTCFLVAERDGDVVGFCHQRGERFGPLGVRPDWRGQGLGRVLVARCLEFMASQQVYYAYFLWAGDDSARMYARVGFKTRREFALLRKAL